MLITQKKMLRDVNLTISGLQVAGLQIGSNTDLCIAFHGWIDNAATFTPLLQYVSGNWIALDLPGHGKSAHRCPNAEYSMAEYVPFAYSAVKALTDQPVTLVGHSMGGSIALMLAAAFPEMVRQLVLIESIGPLTDLAENTAQRLRKGALQRAKEVKIRTYSTIEAAITRRIASFTPISAESARYLVERGTYERENGLIFSHDPHLRRPSLSRMTEAQVLGLIDSIRCSTLLITAKSGFKMPPKIAEHRASRFVKCKHVELSGGHHVHMEQPKKVADLINDFVEKP